MTLLVSVPGGGQPTWRMYHQHPTIITPKSAQDTLFGCVFCLNFFGEAFSYSKGRLMFFELEGCLLQSNSYAEKHSRVLHSIAIGCSYGSLLCGFFAAPQLALLPLTSSFMQLQSEVLQNICSCPKNVSANNYA